MGRRKKELQSVHRAEIAKVAEKLFQKKGIGATSMSEISEISGYSKATLYVYFTNKDELVGYIVMQSMQKLKSYLEEALNSADTVCDRFFNICRSLRKYHDTYPLYTEMLQKTINIDENSENFLPEEKETFLVGEQINDMLKKFIDDGVKSGELRSDLSPFPLIMSIWSMITGLIITGSNKEEYLTKIGNIKKDDFFEFGYRLIYNAISTR
ncbi:MAG: TetR/AcrR family transcriptional regulator [Succinivibrio sp.]